MCGICGIAGSSIEDLTTAQHKLRKMIARIAHRGPDGEGEWILPQRRIALGHTRLAILDVSDAGKQPMHLDTLHCVVNGEIYNYPELRLSLETLYNAKFFSHCDSEVVLHGYRHEGMAFFKRLNGMFAIALYDETQDKLILLRDRAGIKPLYYCQKNGLFAFASEIKSLLAAYDETQWKIDSLGLSQYMSYQTALAGRTLFSDVSLLAPGHVLIVSHANIANIESAPFFEEHTELNPHISFAKATADYHHAFSESVSRHLLSDVPVASYISAGFDSASVATQAAKNSGAPLTAFTGSFRGAGIWYDEASIARHAVENFGGNHVCVDIDSDDLIKELDAVIDALDEPKMGMGAFPQYMVAKAAAKNFKVILTGHGGDELFSGYPVFRLTQLGTLTSIKRSEIMHLGYFLWSRFRRLFSPEFGRHMAVVWSMRMQQKLRGKTVLALRPWHELEQIHLTCKNTADCLFRTYMEAYLPNLLVVEDKISMAHAIESRTPMLDNAMVELSKTIPQKIKLHGGELKAIIKENARTLLPVCFFKQPKKGFPTPLRLWLRGPLKGLLHERLLGNKSRLYRIFDTKVLEKYIHRYEHSYYRHIRPLDEIQSHRMWQLLSLEAWLRIWEEKYGIMLVIK
ncbi:MAG: asparagine synthase (glutamine-hydrolyzing) [Alphaproteobacteria bacterium]|nr:asparagine synthase (glutamine-hydrolyzing) [Alphaproteobacteria bacterium]